MRKLKLRWQVFIATSVILVILIIIISTTVSTNFRKNYINSLIDNLDQNTFLMGEIIKAENLLEKEQDPVDKIIDNFSKETDSRITLIKLDGTVLSESSLDAVVEMDNHINRPEIKEAISNKAGYSIRYSTTVKSEMLYYAYRIDYDSTEPMLFIRAAIPLNEIDLIIRTQVLSIFWYALITVVILLIINSLIIGKLLEPLELIKQGFRNLSDGHYGLQITQVKSNEEIESMTTSFNSMSSKLEKSMDAVKRKELELNTLIELMNSGLLFIDQDEKVVLINRKAKELLGYSGSEDIKYQSIARSSELLEAIERAFRKRQSISKELRLKMNSVKSVKASITPILIDGIFNGIIVLITDITDLKEAVQARQDLITNISHELRTPVTSITGCIETIRDMDDDDPAIKEFLDIIENESRRLSKLINDLLELARIESGRLSIDLRPVSINSVIDNSLNVLQKSIKSKNISVYNNLASDLPKIYVDEVRTEQVVINILTNAIKYSNNGGSITIDSLIQEDCLIVKFKDKGIGISDDKITRLTEQFYRVDQSRSKLNADGYGLGLAIVNNLLKLQNGELAIQSKSGQGTIVSIALPIFNE